MSNLPALGPVIFCVILVLLGLKMFIIDGCPDFHTYWMDRFNDGQAEEICNSNGHYKVMGQSPRDIECRNNESSFTFTYRRPHTTMDTMVELFCIPPVEDD